MSQEEPECDWQRRPRGSWHLMRAGTDRTYCGRVFFGRKVSPRWDGLEFREMPVDPWPDHACWSCMDNHSGAVFGRYWSKP